MSQATPSPDAVVVGAGIVGAACAWALAQNGFRVTTVDPGPVGGGASAAGMGHLCVLDDNDAQFALTLLSCRMWDAIAPDLPRHADRAACGTLWAANDEEEMGAVFRKESYYRARGVAAYALDADQIREAEPNLHAPGGGRPIGGLLLPEDSIIYAPPVCRWFLDRAAEKGGRHLEGRRVTGIAEKLVTLDNGRTIPTAITVVATGCWAPELFPGIPVRPRKGHLAITDRMPGFLRHQVIELAYIKNAHATGPAADESVSFNVQPRPNGQLLIGSSRQFSFQGSEVEPRMMAKVLHKALGYLPGVAHAKILRTWTGFRAATPDGVPIVGPHPAVPGLFLATGHEGLGLTAATGTAALIAALATGQMPPIPAEPYFPSRLAPASDPSAEAHEAATT